MTAPRTTRAKQLRRKVRLVRLLTFPLPFVAFGLGALAVDLSMRDSPRRCLEGVSVFAKRLDSTLPSDPVFVSFAFRRVTDAAELCERGQRGEAREVLESLRESLRV